MTHQAYITEEDRNGALAMVKVSEITDGKKITFQQGLELWRDADIVRRAIALQIYKQYTEILNRLK